MITKASKLLFPTSFGSFIRNVPAEAFRGFANGGSPCSINCSLYFLKLFLLISTSPLISTCCNPYAENFAERGILFICLIFVVISSLPRRRPGWRHELKDRFHK
jgi:hypothetical protein